MSRSLPLRVGSLLLGASALVACGDEETLAPVPVDIGIGSGFRGTLEDGDRLVIASDDGRVLLDGLSPGEVTEGDPPLVGLAVRDVTTSYEMQFGAFKPTDEAKGPWRVATKLTPSTDGDAAVLDLADAAGDALAKARLTTPEQGHLILEVVPGAGPERRFSMGFACDAADHFAGFGSQTADVDHRGQTVPAFVQEQGIGKDNHDEYTGAWFLAGRRHSSHIPIPQYLARRGYVLTTETNREARFALCSESETAARVEVDLPVKIHLFDGPSPAAALERATATFGRPRMPPRVAFAPWNDAIFGSENVRAVAQKLRDEKIPTSVIWSEDWKGGEISGENYTLSEEWEVDTTLYPDFPQLADDLHGLGFHFHVYFNPFIYEDSSVFAETAEKGWLVKREDGSPYVFTGAKFTNSGLIDLSDPGARAWVVGKMRDAIALGADGWMNDFAEWLPTDSVNTGGSGMDLHNVYPVLWQEVAREAIDGAPDAEGAGRLFFGRSGWLGTPALADVIWAGDQRTSMQPDDGLPTILPIGIGLGIGGVSTYGHDIGGYQSATNAVTDKETFFRWASLGAWSPVMRTHHGTKPSYPAADPPFNPDQWTWDKDAETIDHFRKYTSLHIALAPTWEGLARVAADTGLPIWRGLFLAFPEDEATWPILDEVMVGDGILLAPVMEQGKTSRSVYLPEGTWYPWSGGAPESGPKTIDVDAGLGEIPVFARQGTVVVAYPEGVMTLVNSSPEVPGPESVGDDRVVYLFLGASGSFTEAGGLSYSLTQTGALSGALSFTLSGGGALSACVDPVAAPCVESLEDREIVHVTGPADLVVAGGGGGQVNIVASGGAPGRGLTFVVRR